MYIPEDFIDKLLETVDIVDVIGQRINIQRSGSSFTGLCPFHPDKKPSFSINQQKQFYHCWSCKASGNAIKFIRDYEGLDFIEAVETLASSVNLEIPYKNTGAPKTEQVNYDILDRAVNFYEDNLKSTQGTSAVDYLKNRNISGLTAKKFELGFAFDKWDALYNEVKLSFDQKTLIDSGLFKEKKNKEFYDRLRNRLIFPIRNIRGKHIGFGGRRLNDADQQAKYLNSPETLLFNKSNELYGLFEARREQKKLDALVVVEGYMDVIGLHEHGVPNAVATMGTAVTSRHLAKLLRYTSNIFFAFDGDEAGGKAAWKAFENILPILREDTRIKYVFFDKEHDPDSYIQAFGKEAFDDLLKHGLPLSQFFLNRVKEVDDLTTIEGRSKAAAFGAKYIGKLRNDFLKAAFTEEISKLCGMSLSGMIEQTTPPPINPNTPSSNEAKGNNQDNNILTKTIILLIQSLLVNPVLAQHKLWERIPQDSPIATLNELQSTFHNSSSKNPSQLMEYISNEGLKDLFSQAMVGELQMSPSDAEQSFEDCMQILLKNFENREEWLKSKYNAGSISQAERIEFQQLILEKETLDATDRQLLQQLSATRD